MLARREQIPLRGEHNVENVLAACAAAYLAGALPAAIAERRENVSRRRASPGIRRAKFRGVQFYNDSKATNVDAAVKAVEAFPGPLVVILGGKDKGSPYTPLRDLLHERARLALLIGEAAEKIAADLQGAVEIRHAGTLERALRHRHGSRAARRHRAARAGLFQFRSIRELRTARPRFQGTGGAARENPRRRAPPSRGRGERITMPRSLQPDKQFFGVTLALCLIGAVMVFSASAMTAQEQFGAGYIFLLRQLIYMVLGIAGMFWLMNIDYRKLRQPRVVFTGLA